MTKEQIEQNAEEYSEKHAFRVPYDGSNKFYDDVDYKAPKDGYINGALSRQPEIEELKAQVEELEQKLEQTEKDLADYQFNYPSIKELSKENAELKAQIENEIEEKIEWADRCLEYENKYRQQNIELTYERKTNNELKGLLEKLLNPLCSSEDLQRAREYLKNQEIKNVFQFMQRGNELLKE